MANLKTISLSIFCFLFFQTIVSGQFVYGDDASDADFQSAVKPPISELQPIFSNYSVVAEKGVTLIAKEDTEITIPANAFVDHEGNVVKGKVDIHYREFKNPVDIFLSGIPMTVEENGKEEFFQSAGMIEFRASQNEAPVFPNPNSEPINIELSSNQTDDDFQLYALNEKSGEWLESGPSKIVKEEESSFKGSKLSDFETMSAPPRLARPSCKVKPPRIRVVTKNTPGWNARNKKSLQFRMEGTRDYDSPLSFNYNHGKYFSELYHKKPTNWIYDGPNRMQARQLLKQFSKANYYLFEEIDSMTNYSIKDIRITPNEKGDNFLIKFICGNNSTYTIEAYPYFSINTVTGQKRTKAFYEEYVKAYHERNEIWEKTDKAYVLALQKYKEQQATLKDEFLLSSFVDKSENVNRRRIGVITFGILNIDKVMKKLNDERPLVFNLNGEKTQNVNVVYVLDETNNALLSYYAGQKIRFDKRAKNSLIVAFDDDTFATISNRTFRSVLRKSTKTLEFSLDNLPFDSITKKSLKDALAIN